MKPQFTPGPWALEYDVDGIPLTIIGSDGSAIGTIETWNDHTKGNRHIITAAPDMYTELMKQRDWLLHIKGQIQAPNSVLLGFDQSIKYINRVLAQARGEVNNGQ